MTDNFSFGSFSIFKQLIKFQTKDQSSLKSQEMLNTYQNLLKMSIQFIMKKDNSQMARQTFKKFLSLYSQAKFRLNIDLAIQNMHQVSFMVCDQKRIYNIDKERQDNRCFVVYGKAISAYKRSKKNKNQSAQQEESRDNLATALFRTMFRMYEDGKLPFVKTQPHEVQDLLLSHQILDDSIQPIYIGNQLFFPCFPANQAIIMILPEKMNKPECLSLIKGSLLHIYLENVNVIHKIVTKQIFYKNTHFKGIYFVESGEVEVKSGRIVARGWVTNGKCKNSGVGWRFKPMPFVKFVGKNQHIWKQFTNDLMLNEQLPFKITNILNIEKDYQNQQNEELLAGNKKKKRVKFPKLTGINKSFDINKFHQIQKVKHFDVKINNLYEYKKDIYQRKLLGNSLHKSNKSSQVPLQSQPTERQLKKIEYLSKKGSLDYKKMERLSYNNQSSSQNILIVSVLKKLQSLSKHSTVSQQEKIQKQVKKMPKILGLIQLQKQKSHRCKGKNRYL